MLNARITFGNIFALDKAVAGVTSLSEDERRSCCLDEAIFEAPSNYSVIGMGFDRLVFAAMYCAMGMGCI